MPAYYSRSVSRLRRRSLKGILQEAPVCSRKVVRKFGKCCQAVVGLVILAPGHLLTGCFDLYPLGTIQASHIEEAIWELAVFHGSHEVKQDRITTGSA